MISVSRRFFVIACPLLSPPSKPILSFSLFSSTHRCITLEFAQSWFMLYDRNTVYELIIPEAFALFIRFDVILRIGESFDSLLIIVLTTTRRRQYDNSCFMTDSSPTRMLLPLPPPSLTFDSLCHALSVTVLSPFVAIPCILAIILQRRYNDDLLNFSQYGYLELALSTYALGLFLVRILGRVNARLAHGPRRAVDVQDEVVVIAGGAGGLGSCIAGKFVERGSRVAVLDRRVDECRDDETTRKEGEEGMQTSNDRIRFYACDVSKQDDVESACGRIVSYVRNRQLFLRRKKLMSSLQTRSTSRGAIYSFSLLKNFRSLALQPY